MFEFFITYSVRKGFITMSQNLEAIKSVSVNVNININISDYINILNFYDQNHNKQSQKDNQQTGRRYSQYISYSSIQLKHKEDLKIYFRII